MGNMGGAQSICQVQQLHEGHAVLHLGCEAGSISTTAVSKKTGAPILQMGVIPSSSDYFGWCANDAFVDEAECTNFLDTNALSAKIVNDCAGRQSCSINNLRSYMKESQGLPTSLAQVKTSSAIKLLKSAGNKINEQECLGDKASIFIQVGCTLPEEEVV